MNDQQVDNRNAPSYLSHYGMFRAPFMNTVEDDMYYAEPTRTQRLDILLHLAQYGNELLLVTGPEGSGKTTMLHQFMKKIGEGWMVCQINAHNMLTEAQLLSRISRGFDLPDESGPVDSVTANLKRRLDALLTTHQTVIIAVDNAQVLSTEALNLLLEFASIRNLSKGIAVRILLFSEPQIKILLASPDLQSRQTLPIRKIDLPPFDEQQTARLIRHRVTTAGLVSKHVFNDAIVSKIYKYSQGWPGLITEIAHQVLFESTPIKRRDTGNKKGENGTAAKSGKLVTIISVTLVAAALAGLILFQDQINALFKSDHGAAKPQQAEKIAQPLAIPAPTQTLKASPTQREEEELEFPVINKVQSVPAASPEPSSTPATEPPPLPAPVPVEPSPPPTEARPDQGTAGAPPLAAATTQQQDNAPPAEEPAAAATGHAIPLAHQEEWIMEQDPGYFTLQVVAGYQASTVLKFIDKEALPESELAYYYSLNRGKGWHSLLFGSYPNRDQAKGAAVELGKQLKHIKPWIRTFKSVQGDILYARSRSQ